MSMYIIFLTKVRREGKPFLEGTSIDLSSKLSLTYGGNVNHHKRVHPALSTLSVETENTLAVFKTNDSALLAI